MFYKCSHLQGSYGMVGLSRGLSRCREFVLVTFLQFNRLKGQSSICSIEISMLASMTKRASLGRSSSGNGVRIKCTSRSLSRTLQPTPASLFPLKKRLRRLCYCFPSTSSSSLTIVQIPLKTSLMKSPIQTAICNRRMTTILTHRLAATSS